MTKQGRGSFLPAFKHLHDFKMKKTLRYAPDAVVYINRDTTLPVCQGCGGRRSFQGDVQSISVSNTTDSVPGSCSVNIPLGRHDFRDYIDQNGQLVFKPMQEIEVWMKGQFLVDGEPRYYPVFWGLIYNISQELSTDIWSINLSCVDMLKWWELTTVVVNPSVFDVEVAGNNTALTPMQQIFSNFNPYEVILSLAVLAFGNIASPSNLSLGENFELVERIIRDQYSGLTGPQSNPGFIRDIISYWQYRFQSVSRRLKIFGVNGYRINADVANVENNIGEYADHFWKQALPGRSNRSMLPGLIYDQDEFSRFRADEFLGNGFSLFESQVQTKLEIAAAASQVIGYEFFQDMNGDLVFKPPFYNMDTRDAGRIYRLEEEDLVSFNPSYDASAIYTRCDVTGRFVRLVQENGTVQVNGFYIDYNLMKKFGFRNLSVTAAHLRTARSCMAYAVGLLSKENSKARTATATIVGRPEIRLGRPVYIPAEDSFYYVTGISHSFSFGGQFQTTLTLSSERRKYLGPGESTEQDTDPEQVVLGPPNRVLRFKSDLRDRTGPRVPCGSELSGSGEDFGGLFGGVISRAREEVERRECEIILNSRPELNDRNAAYNSELERQIQESDERSGRTFGNRQGIYEEVEIPGVFAAGINLIPVSDEFGYEHFGAFPFGRGMTIGELDTVKPSYPETREPGAVGEQPRVESTFGLELRRSSPSAIQQFGLEAGVPLNPNDAEQLVRDVREVEFEATNNPVADNVSGTEMMTSRAHTSSSGRDIAAQQNGTRPSTCTCSETTRDQAEIQKMIEKSARLQEMAFRGR